jgi:hypothetical protein
MTQMAFPGMEPPEQVAKKLPPAKTELDKPPAPMGWLKHKGTRCRTCQAEIVFGLLTRRERGADVTKPHPYDLAPDPDGTTHLVAEGRNVRAYFIPKKARGGRLTLHKSHWKTCPQAEQWRRGEAPSEPRE